MTASRSVVVIGAGVGGLSAAIHARLRGADVLVLEAAGATGGKARGFQVAGFDLDPGPSIVILPQLYDALFAAAGRRMRDYLRFERLDPISRVYFEGEPPVDIPADRAQCEELIARIAPEDAAPFRLVMAKLDRAAPAVEQSVFRRPYDRLWRLADPKLIASALPFDVRRSYKRLIDQAFRSPFLRAFFYGFPSYGGQTYDAKSFGPLLIPYFMLRDGVFYPEGGVAAIPRALERLARELGVEFRFGARVSEFGVRGRRVRTVRLESGEGIEAEAYVSNVDRLTTRRRLGIDSDLGPSFSYFTLQLGLRRRPTGLSHHTLFVPKNFEAGFEALYRARRFPDPPIVYVNDPGERNPNAALLLVVTAPAADALDWSDLAPLRQATLETIRRCGIELDADGAAFERAQTPVTFQREHGNWLGSLYGPDERHRLYGLFPQRNWDERYANLFYCGASVQPGAGLPMVLLSGKFAADLACRGMPA